MTTVDERIVEAKFDSKDFEKGVDKTVKKLDELKDALKLKDQKKNITDLTNEASSSLKKIEERMTTFVGTIKQKIITGFADQVVGAFFNVTRSVENLVKTLITGGAEMHQGMQRYTDIMTSVRTMVVAGEGVENAYNAVERLGQYADQTSYSLDGLVDLMAQLKAGGVGLESATQMVEGLSNAAASVGINAQRAQYAYTNFAQAYRKGYMLQQDWMSFENIGMSVEAINKKILEAAEEAGTLVKQKDGTYKTSRKTNKEVRTSGSDSKGITAANMGSKLSSRWFTKEVMEKFSSMFYFENIDRKTLKKYTDMEKAVREGTMTNEAFNKALEDDGLSRFAYDAFRAGQEARSLTDVMNTLKDVISRGWATSFELIFGKLEEAKEFFTWLTESNFANAIYALGDFRNGILERWSTAGGADHLKKSLKDLDEIFGDLMIKLGIFSDDDDKDYGAGFTIAADNIGDTLLTLTADFGDFVKNLREWFDTADKDGVTRLDKIANIIKGVGSTFGTVVGIIGAAFKAIGKVIGIALDGVYKAYVLLEPTFNALGTAAQKVLEPMLALVDPKQATDDSPYTKLQQAFANILTVVEPLTKALPSILGVVGDVAAFFASMALDTVVMNLGFINDLLGLVIEMFGGESAQIKDGQGVWDGIVKSIQDLGNVCKQAFEAVRDFFGSVIDDVKVLLGLGEQTDTEEGGFFTNIKKFFDTNDFIQTVKKNLRELPGKIWDFIFGKEVKMTIDNPSNAGGKLEVNYFKDGVVQIVGKALNSAWEWVTTTLPDEINKLWNKILDFFLGEKVTDTDVDEKGNRVEHTYRIKSAFALWFEDTIDQVKEWIKDIPNKVADLWNTITDFIFGKKTTIQIEDRKTGQMIETTTRIKDGFSEWLANTITAIGDWIKDIPNKVSDIWNWILDLFLGEKKTIQVKDRKTNKMIEVTTRVKKGFSLWLDNTIKSVKKWIKDIPTNINKLWNDILDLFLGKKVTKKVKNEETGEEEEVTERVKDGFSLWLSDTLTAIWNWIETIPSKISDIWNGIIDFIFGKKTTIQVKDRKTGEMIETTTRVKEGFSEWLSETISKIKEWFKSLPSKIKTDIWDPLVEFLFGKKVTVQIPDRSTGKMVEVQTTVESEFSLWFKETVESIKTWITETVPTAISGVWNDLLDAIFGKTKEGKNEEQAQRFMRSSVHPLADQFKRGYEKENIVEKAAREFAETTGLDIGKILSEDIPTFIVKGWTGTINLFDDLFHHVEDFFTGKNEEREKAETEEQIIEKVQGLMGESAEDVAKKIEGENVTEEASPLLTAVIGFGQKLYQIITGSIPGMLSAAWDFVSHPTTEGGNGWWDKLSNILGLDNFNWGKIEGDANEIGNKLSETIKEIPGKITAAITTVKSLFPNTSGFNKELYDKLLAEDRMGNHTSNRAQEYVKQVTKETGMTMEQIQNIIEGKTLGDTIKNVGGAIKEAFTELGPYILDGIGAAFDWLTKNVDKATEKMNEASGEGKGVLEILSEKITDDEKTESPLWAKIKEIGQKIFDFITKTIPGFVTAAVEQVKIVVPKILNGLFGGDGNNANQEVERQLEEQEAKTLQTVEKAGFSLIDNMEQVQNMVQNKANQQNDGNFLGWLLSGGAFMSVGNAEDAVDNATSEVDDSVQIAQYMVDRLEYIQQMKDEITKYTQDKTGVIGSKHTLSPSDQAKLNELDEKINKRKEIIGQLNEIADEKIDKRKYNPDPVNYVEQSVISFSSILDSLSKISLSKEAAVAAIIIGLGYLFEKLLEPITIADEIEAVGYTAKWEAIKILVLGLVGMLAWCSYLVQQEDSNQPNSKYQKTIAMLTTLAGFLEQLGNVVITIMSIWATKETIETAGDAFAIFGKKSGKEVAESVFGAGITKILATGAGIALSDLLSSAIEDTFSKLAEVFGDIGVGIDLFISTLNPALEKMAQMAENASVAQTVIDRIRTFYSSLSDLVRENDDASKDAVDPEHIGKSRDERYHADIVLGAIESRLDTILAISSFMNNISNAMATMEKVKDVGEQMRKLNLVVGSDEFKTFLCNTIAKFMQACVEGPTWNGNFEKATWVKNYGQMFMYIASIMEMFSDSFTGLTLEKATALSQIFDVIGAFGAALKENEENGIIAEFLQGDSSLGHFGVEITKFMSNLHTVFTRIDNIKTLMGNTEEGINLFDQAVATILHLTTGLATAAAYLNGSGVHNFEELGLALPKFANDMREFFTILKNDWYVDVPEATLKQAERGINMILKISEMVSNVTPVYGNGALPSVSLIDLMNSILGEDDINYAGSKVSFSFIETVNTFMGALKEKLSPTNFQGIGYSAGENLDKGLSDGLNANGLATETAARLASAIQEAIDTDVTVTITPVINMETFDDQIKKYTAPGYILSGPTPWQTAPNVTPPSATEANQNGSIDYTGDISRVTNELSDLRQDLRTVSTAISKIKFVINGGQLVGSIGPDMDRWLGTQGFYVARTSFT